MDNRRLSARAEMGAAAPTYRPGAVPFLDRVIEVSAANWEIFLYVGLMLLAVLTRVWDLGPRALHHDESIHAYYSNLYMKGGGYGYDPTYHGPFLYHMVALGFMLFGSTDATARIMPAFFGIALIGLIWLLRPFIGRVATLIAMAIVILSPSISYYSRSLRHDIFALTGTMLLFVGLLYFLRTHRATWLYLSVAGFAIAFTSHELTYIIGLLFFVFLAGAAFLFNTFSDRKAPNARSSRFVPDANPVTSALASLGRQRWTILIAVLVFVAIFTVLFTNVLTEFTYLSHTFTHVENGQKVQSNVPFFFGLFEGLAYWAGQHEVNRGTQPQWYYLMMMPIYEPLAFFAGIGTMIYAVVRWFKGDPDRYADVDIAEVPDAREEDEFGVALPSTFGMRGFTMSFLIFWSLGSLVAFSIAGERLPWLLMQPALPFSLLAAYGLGILISKLEWKQVVKGGGVFLAVTVVLFLFAAFALIASLTGRMPAVSGAGAGLQNTLRIVLLFAFTVGLLALAGWLAYKMMPGRAVAMVGVTFAVILALYGLRSMMLVNYRHGDVPVDMIVYTQTAPDVPIVTDLIKRLSRDETAFDAGRTAADVTGGRSLQVTIDQSVEWPFDWYLRDMRSISYFNVAQWQASQANVIPPSVPVIIASDETVANPNFQNAVKNKYASTKYVLRWWFPEELYKTNNQGDFGKYWAWVTNLPAYGRYLLYRDPGLPLGSTNFTLYVRNDLAVKVGLPGSDLGGLSTGSAAGSPTEDTTSPPQGMLDGGPASNKRGAFNLPRGIARDPSGNFFVVDTGNFRIQKFGADGKWINSFGSRGTGDGQFNSYDETAVGTGPGGIAVDQQGNVYVADTWNHRIEKFDNNGKFVAKWGSFINMADAAAAGDADRDSKFFGPRGVAVGSDNNVYVTDTGNKRVLIFDTSGKFLRKIDSGVGPQKKSPEYPFNKPGEMNEPMGIVVDAAGNVYVADTNNQRIQKFSNTGAALGQWPLPAGAWSAGPYLEPFLAVDTAGNIYASAPTGKEVVKYSPSGQLLGEKKAEGAATLKTPTGLVIATDGTIYVVDAVGNTVINFGKM